MKSDALSMLTHAHPLDKAGGVHNNEIYYLFRIEQHESGVSMVAAIDVRNLTKRYDALTALSDISFQVQPGEIMGFLGPNGAGKTTTLRILTGIIAPTSGSIRINDIDVAERPLEVRRQIGYLPENVALYPEMRVSEYLDYRSRIKGISSSDRKTRIDHVVRQCALTDVQRRLIGRLSKGYRQRVALADCLLAKPSILILDEPTVGLDPHQIRQTRELIIALGQSTTILLSTHILPEVEMVCRRVAIIDRGRILAVDTPDKLRSGLSTGGFVRVQLKAPVADVQQALGRLAGVKHVVAHGQSDGFAVCDVESASDTDVRESIFRLAVERNWTLRELAAKGASLEDVFVHLTTHEQDTEVSAPTPPQTGESA